MSDGGNLFIDLIAPLSPSDLSALWRARALKLQRCSGENRFPLLFDCDALWRLIEGATLPSGACRVTYAGRIVSPALYANGDALDPDRLAKLFAQGVSMIVDKLDTYEPALSAVCREARASGIPAVFAGAIVTTGAGGALDPHYDPQDLIILQVEGSKRWRVFGPRVLRPIKQPTSALPPQTPPILDTMLAPGDLLFLPAGYWHVCDNGGDRSLHLGLFLRRPGGGRGTSELADRSSGAAGP